MTYIENIFVCLAIPLLLALLFTRSRERSFVFFLLVGMTVCLLAAYVSGFFMRYYDTDEIVAAVEITPVCEEVLKLAALLFYYKVWEPKPEQLPSAAIAIAVGFATFENVCYLTENGAAEVRYVLIRGISAGAVHILCGIAIGFGLSRVFTKKWLALTGCVGILGVSIVLHAIYNLLISASGGWRIAGYVFPAATIGIFWVSTRLYEHWKKRRVDAGIHI